MDIWQWAIGVGVAFLAGVLIPTGAMLTKIGALVQVVTQLSVRMDKMEATLNDLSKVVYEMKGTLGHGKDS